MPQRIPRHLKEAVEIEIFGRQKWWVNFFGAEHAIKHESSHSTYLGRNSSSSRVSRGSIVRGGRTMVQNAQSKHNKAQCCDWW